MPPLPSRAHCIATIRPTNISLLQCMANILLLNFGAASHIVIKIFVQFYLSQSKSLSIQVQYIS
jgi:hypothetical protein